MNVICPIEGKLSRYPSGIIIQGWGENPALYVSYGFKGHTGWDLIKGYGYPIVAPTSGTVVSLLFQNMGYGHLVQILSDETQDGWQLLSEMGHMVDQAVVQLGEHVKQGDLVGYMGNSGFVVSGGVQYWGESNPDHRGTHTHWKTQWLKQVPTGSPSNTSYLGKNYLIKNYGNGYDNSFDPALLFPGDFMANEAKIVKSKKSPSVYWCYEMPSMEYLATKANIEGVAVPTDIPDTDTL